jgi:hypothetical protein
MKTEPHILAGKPLKKRIGTHLRPPPPAATAEQAGWKVYRSTGLLAVEGPNGAWMRCAHVNYGSGLCGTALEVKLAQRTAEICAQRHAGAAGTVSRLEIRDAWRQAARELGADPLEFPI